MIIFNSSAKQNCATIYFKIGKWRHTTGYFHRQVKVDKDQLHSLCFLPFICTKNILAQIGRNLQDSICCIKKKREGGNSCVYLVLHAFDSIFILVVYTKNGEM